MAALAAVSASPEVVKPMREEFNKRRDLAYSLLKEIPNIKCNLPAGAFYFFPDISAYFGKSYNGQKITNSAELCMFLLNQVHVAVVSGDAFGDMDCFRISYAASEDVLKRAIERSARGLAALS